LGQGLEPHSRLELHGSERARVFLHLHIGDGPGGDIRTRAILIEEAHALREDGIYQWADAALGESERTSLVSAIARTVRDVVHRDGR
jgi:hypothetical protein